MTPIAPSELKTAEVVSQTTGEKWVYSEIVKDHFFHPRNLLLTDPTPGEFDAEGVVGSPACLAPDTLVRSMDMLTPINELAPGNPVTAHNDHIYPISRVIRPKQEDGMLTFVQTQLGNITMTPDHLVYSISVPRAHRYRYLAEKKKLPKVWNHAADLEPRDLCIYPIPHQTVGVDKILVPQDRKHWDFKSKPLPTEVPLDAGLLELFGYFIAEGNARRAEIQFTFGSHERVLGERVKTLIAQYFNLEARLKARGTRLDVSVYNTHLSRWFLREFGKGAVLKQIPNYMLFLSPELQKSLMRGLWRGDGYVNLDRRVGPRAGYVTISPLLAQQIKLLLLRQRVIPSLYVEPAHKRKGVSHRESYRIHVGDTPSLERLCEILEIPFHRSGQVRIAQWSWEDGNEVFVPIKKVVQTPARYERLYNIEVPEAHTYLTDAFAVHNCGDVMQVWLKVADDRITDLKWRTFGCGSAIAATSMFSVMVTENGGMQINNSLKVKPQDIMARLGGLPNRKIHCSVLVDKAFRKAVNEYFRATGQHERVVVEGAKVIDARLNITDKDIEEAVLEGATTLEDVQKKLKVGVGDPESIPAIEQLIRFYKEKYYG